MEHQDLMSVTDICRRSTGCQQLTSVIDLNWTKSLMSSGYLPDVRAWRQYLTYPGSWCWHHQAIVMASVLTWPKYDIPWRPEMSGVCWALDVCQHVEPKILDSVVKLYANNQIIWYSCVKYLRPLACQPINHTYNHTNTCKWNAKSAMEASYNWQHLLCSMHSSCKKFLTCTKCEIIWEHAHAWRVVARCVNRDTKHVNSDRLRKSTWWNVAEKELEKLVKIDSIFG